MKKIFVLAVLLTVGYYASAQVYPHALGLRLFGSGKYNGAEISYQHGLNDTKRLEGDLSFGFGSGYSRLQIVGIHQWVWNIDGGFNWFAGPGAAVSFDKYEGSNGYVNLGLGGQIGAEYDFNTKDVPLVLSLDVRPMWNFLGDHSGFGWGAAIGIRYTF
ncbi:MAG: hypothetical protein PHP30_00645 [Bacteroidales bacterium]|nr:hypothetical protein [Bacteroidales bacterium]MDD2425090.1 hypothetical protein [Bacteroidales bacterium]MDD3988593.1 hypothetical protein [Bacteroidales bacterium]MDD4639361.1 hypothetical protein [Bacteroidales bacterium]